MMSSRSARAVSLHLSPPGTALPFDQGLSFIHDFPMLNGWPCIGQGFVNLISKPGIVGLRVSSEADRKGPFLDDASKQNAHGIGYG
mgnify:CR=1 FL=1